MEPPFKLQINKNLQQTVQSKLLKKKKKKTFSQRIFCVDMIWTSVDMAVTQRDWKRRSKDVSTLSKKFAIQ